MCLIVGRQQSRYHLIRQPVQSGEGGAAECVCVCVGRGEAVGGGVLWLSGGPLSCNRCGCLSICHHAKDA